MSFTCTKIIPHCILKSKTPSVSELLLTLRQQELLPEAKHPHLYYDTGRWIVLQHNTLEANNSPNLLKAADGGRKADPSVEESEGIVMKRIWSSL